MIQFYNFSPNLLLMTKKTCKRRQECILKEIDNKNDDDCSVLVLSVLHEMSAKLGGISKGNQAM